MNRSEIDAAIERGAPFTQRMADGHEYQVPHRDYIALSPRGTVAVVFDDVAHVWVLPLLTMSGLMYKEPKSKS